MEFSSPTTECDRLSQPIKVPGRFRGGSFRQCSGRSGNVPGRASHVAGHQCSGCGTVCLSKGSLKGIDEFST